MLQTILSQYPQNEEEKELEEIEYEKRRKNLMIFRLIELSEEDDRAKVEEVLKILQPEIDTSFVNVTRVGKTDGYKIRPIRVFMNHMRQVVTCIANEAALRSHPEFSELAIAFDRTPLQTKEYFRLKFALAKRPYRERDQYRIKYINNIPQIVKKAKYMN